jgi:phosphate-selective porin OprO/OprP
MNMLRQARLGLAAVILTGAIAAPVFAQATDEPKPEPVDVFQGAGILVAQTPDGAFKWWLDGRLNLDTAYYFNSDNTLANGVELRRARFAINMALWKTWAAQFDVDFVENAVDVKDAWVGYTGLPNTVIRVGNFRTPFGLETLTSSRYITFMERSLVDNFSPDRRMGIGASRWGNRWTAAAGVFGPELADTNDTIGQDQTSSLVGRVTVLPVSTSDGIVHIGLAAARMDPTAPANATLSDANRWRMRARPESHVNRGRFIDTGQVKNVDHASLYGLEAAATWKSFSFQSEYNRETLRRTSSEFVEPTYDGYYAFVSWFPTGEHRPYDRTEGSFGRVLPKSSKGALELAVRYSTMDLNDAAAGVFGGKEEILTFGVNWYVNANIRLMTNYLYVKNDDNAKGDRSYIPGDKFNVVQMRLGLMF